MTEPLRAAMHDALFTVLGHECDHAQQGVPDCETMVAALAPRPEAPTRTFTNNRAGYKALDDTHATLPHGGMTMTEPLRAALEWALKWVPKFTDDDHGIDPDKYRAAHALLAADTGHGETTMTDHVQIAPEGGSDLD